MEQVDAEHMVTVKGEDSEITIDLHPIIVEPSNDNVIKPAIIPTEGPVKTEASYTDTVVETTLTDDCDEKVSAKKDEAPCESNVIAEQLSNHSDNEPKLEITTDIKVEDDCPTKDVQASEGTQAIEESVEDRNKSNCTDSEKITEESTKSLNELETLSAEKDTQSIIKHDICTVIDIDTNDDTSAQCQALLKSLGQNFESKGHSLHVADADLTKLVDGNSEVMVLTVETVPINELNDSTEKDIVVTVHEKDVVVKNNTLSIEEKENKKSEVLNEEFNLIDYGQESDSTIIEVISTEVVDSEISETCTTDEKEIIKSINSNIDGVNATTVDIVNNTETVDDDIEIKEHKVQESFNSDKEDITNQIESKTNDKMKTEVCDNSDKSKAKKEIVHSKVVVPTHINNPKDENVTVNEPNKVGTALKKRSVIQDIFDDWGDENAEEESQSPSKIQDSVEIELKSLLDDNKTTETITEETIVLVEEEITCTDSESATSPTKVIEVIEERKELEVSNVRTDNQNIKMQHGKSIVKQLNKDQVNLSIPQTVGKSSKTSTQDSVAVNQTSQPHVLPIVSRGRNLTSQIASPAEVTEALKERLREKQKIVEAPRGPDIFFVKKLTQRLSSKLAGGPVNPIPALIPLPHPAASSNCDRKTTENTATESSKESNSDNKELLAILEGDVDPDWLNLKPPTLTEEGKGPINVDTGHSTPPKLDPLVERELALKQLLELPVTPMKRTATKKKKALKPAVIKVAKETEVKVVAEKEKQIVKIDLVEDSTELSGKDSPSGKNDSLPANTDQHSAEKSLESVEQDVRLDESRSGRKRKPTEKAREHEQYTTKRQKVYKGKVSVSKRQSQETEAVMDTSSTENHVAKTNDTSVETVQSESDVTITKEVTNKQLANKVDSMLKTENSPLKRPKQNLNKKGSQPIAKRKVVVKKLIRQNMPSPKKSVSMKAKLSTSPKKSATKVVAKSHKKSSEIGAGDAKPKKKIINEIDRLLQDEGVVNLLYDVEQPDKKRLVPITKSHAKVMDIQKVQRELKIRKKLVRNAVLRLRTSSSGVTKVSPRSKRTSVHMGDVNMEKKIVEQVPSLKTVNATMSQSEFIIPAKIRNAADASVIIRRHSSSSFSSASGSPRVSIDGPEKVDGVKLDEGGSHSLRSTKRRHSQDERINPKKSKKKAVQKNEPDTIIVNAVEEKPVAVRPTKKAETKKMDKNSKRPESPATTTTDETSNNPSKVITRSNGTTTGKVTSKSKKSAKNKVTFAKANETDNTEESSKEEDELSACLAEAATALSVVNTSNRSGNSAANRKNKVNANTAKIFGLDNNKVKPESQDQFSNKEISVRRHGNLVQLILTQSSTTKLRNALTLQVMQEFRDILSILKKDDECRVVLLTSTGTSFCEGLELSMILHMNKEERRIRAQEMADAVKDFIKSLASFNKPIVAGVQGAAVGLGVTMLPLFDLVIASDKATFNTPYGKLGQIAEGAAVFTLSHILGSAITSELLLGGRTLTASEALRAGLVTRVLWPDRFEVELLPTLRVMSEQSSQSMEATKALLRHSLRKKLDAALESETYLLIQHWCSTECQTAIKAYIDEKVQ